MNEFYPLKVFEHWMRYWWLPVIVCLVGGLVGFGFNLLHPPVYEATATIYAGLDLNKIAPLSLTESEEDLALGQMNAVLLSQQTIQALKISGQDQHLNVDFSRLFADIAIERQHDIWNLRYRSSDPQLSMELVNLWAEKGYETIQSWQKTGLIKPYIIIDPPSLASLPEKPVSYGQNRLILAGGLSGFIVGLILVSILGKPVKYQQVALSDLGKDPV